MHNRLMTFFMPGVSEPVTWWKGKPVHLTVLLLLAHGIALLGTTLLLAVGAGSVIERMALSYPAALEGQVWRFFTFPLIQYPSFWVLIELAMLWMFGMQVEQAMGWRKFLRLYLLLCFSPAVALLLLSPFSTGICAGTDAANLGVFIAFATLFPNAPMLFNTKAKWWAWALLALVALQSLASASPVGATVLFVAGVAYAYLKLHGALGGFHWFENLRRRSQEARQLRMNLRRQAESRDHFISEKIDPILDKIAREGIQSLTNEERKILERAKDRLK